jgi:hypothetical protein
MIEDAEEWKTFLKIDASLIKETPNDEKLGALVRSLMNEKLEKIEEHIKHIKNAKN